MIGPYRITGLLGSGSMGEVCSGYDQRLDRPVALKHIQARTKGYKRARERFQREARVVARLNHPAIVQVHDWIETAEGIWLVMELVEGHSLRQVLKDGPLESRRCAGMARQILEGLALAHAASVVHRDLKAENIMLTDDERIKILDFGLAKILQADLEETSLTLEGRLVGTVGAMSPEQAVGHPLDHRSDLFSLGILLYEMLTGVSPFYSDHTVRTLIRICSLQQKPVRDLNPEVDPSLSDLVDRLLEKDPDQRPQSAAEAIAYLDAIEESRESRRAPAVHGASKHPSFQGFAPVEGPEASESGHVSAPFAAPSQVVFLREEGPEQRVEVHDESKSLLDLALTEGIPHYHECGGRARCSTCRVRVHSGLENVRPRTPQEKNLARRMGWGEDIRLACQTRITGDVTIEPLVHDALELGLLLEEQAQAVPAREVPIALMSCGLLDTDSFAQRATPQVQMHLLYRFFGQIGSRIPANGGRIEGYFGAGFRAFFGVEGRSAHEKCAAAVRASVRAAARMKVFNRYARSYFSSEFHLGIGLHFARMVVGKLRFPSHSQLLAVGEACPMVDAVKDCNRQAGTSILASEALFNVVEGDLKVGRMFADQPLGGGLQGDLYEVLDFKVPDFYFIVKKTFEKFEDRSEEAGAILYKALFEIDPDLRKFFEGADMGLQGKTFMNMLAAAVKGLEEPDEVASKLQELGRRHREFGVGARHYEVLGKALLQTVERMIGNNLDLDVRLAWERFYQEVAVKNMMVKNMTVKNMTGG